MYGKNKIIENYMTMCSEDFAYFLENRPGAFIFIGSMGDIYYAQHNEKFTVDIDDIILGTEVMYSIAKKYLM